MRKSLKLAAAAAGAASLAMLAAPRVARAWKTWQESRRSAWIAASVAALQRGDESLPPMPFGMETERERGSVERDDPNLRRLVNLMREGPRTPAYRHQLMVLAAAENRKAKALLEQRRAATVQGRPIASAVAATTPATTLSWDNLGPANTHLEYNGSSYQANDTGRPTAIRVDPTDPNVVYLAVSGGGLWKASNFTTGQPDWKPLTDNLGVLALGAMDIDPADPLTLYIGTGDAFDEQGGSVVKSSDGGLSWGAAVQLVAATPALGPVAAGSIRSIAVDPANAQVVLAATDVGLFRSADGGATFSWVDLPNLASYNWGSGSGSTDFDFEATWDVVWLGASSFMVSGSYACPFEIAPAAGFSQVGCASGVGTPPAGGNLGDIWVSSDDGLTWASARMAGTLPTQAAGWGTASDTLGLGDVGRIALGAAPNANPALATVYAEAGSVDEGNSRTVLLFSTRNGGATWNKLGTPLSTNLTNPTTTVTFPDGTTENDCGTLDLGHGQSWYNLAVGVDPANPDHAIMGGNLCGVRTLDGGASWQNASHWLPSAGIGNTQDGPGALPYVHADWHTITVAPGSVVLAGTDGGLFTTSNIFAAGRTQQASWVFPDVGLITHLAYAHATGDPVRGNAHVVYAGFQDNGTRFRLFDSQTRIPDPARTFDQIIGGDGIGCAVASDADGENAVYWASVEFGRLFCRPDARDCSAPTGAGGAENWVFASIPVSRMPAGDGEVFLERFSPTYDAQSSVLTATATHAWKITVDASDNVAYTRLTSAPLNLQNQSIYASPFTYTVGGKPARIYGIVKDGGQFGAIVDDGSGTFPLTLSATGMHVGSEFIRGATSVAFPRDPANLGGTDIRNTYVGTSGNTTEVGGNPVSEALGHIFKTSDGGTTWTPIHGAGVPAPGGLGTMDLPNIAITVVRFDPGDSTDQTLYVGTDLGLYRTTDGGSSWARYGNLPAVRITDISASQNGSLLRVSTYGRGLWEIYPHSEAAGAPGNGDWDHNGVIDFLDLAALASRLGASAGAPTSVPAKPRYDSALDLAGGATQVEDADLSALLGKFGSTP